MQEQWFPIVDQLGHVAQVASLPLDPTRVAILLSSGERLVVSRTLVTNESADRFRLRVSFEQAIESGGPMVVPVIEEKLVVEKRSVERENVRIETSVSTHHEPVDLMLARDDLRVERTAIGRTVDSPTGPRQEGDTYVLPIYEEVVVVEKRLVLKEEVRVTRIRGEHRHQEHVELRREDVRVERIDTPTDGKERS